jgi:8-oxo-dGTP pyrophosphatase MutT (NUDIX family)
VRHPNPARRPGGRQIIPRPDDWSPGAPAAWPVDQPAPSVGTVVDRVRDWSTRRHATVSEGPAFDNPRLSAVLAVVADGPSGPEVLLTRRSWELSSHRGEVSFPGGRLDDGETYAQAALREANEEVGLDAAHVRVIGRLSPLSTWVSRSFIVPVVAVADDDVASAMRSGLSAMTMEVERVMWVPLSELMRSDTYHQELWQRGGDTLSINFFHLDDETIWGATARMLVELLRVVT